MPVPPAISRSPLGRLLGLTPPRIKGALDEPGPRQPYARTLTVRGWAVSTDGASLEVSIEVNGQTVWAGAPTAPRADVEPLFPGVATAAACGFAAQLEASALPDVVEATLVVRPAPGIVSVNVPVVFAFGSAASMRMVLLSVMVA